MKRLLSIALILCGITSFSMAQDILLLNYSSLERKLEKSNEQINDNKKKTDAKTWFNRGKLMQDIFELDLENIYDGITPTLVKLYYKEPLSSETKDGMQIDTYERIKYYYQDTKLVRFERLKSVTENPLDKALEAYKKTLQYDDKGKYTSKVKEQLDILKNQYKRVGINAYYLDNKKEALEYMTTINQINQMDMFKGVVDTIMVQYAGIIAREIGDYPRAIEAYKELTKMDFGGASTFLIIKNDYIEMGDSAQAISILKEAFQKYPDTLNVVANLVDMYIRTEQIDQGLETINQSLESNPRKGELYYWKGRLLLNQDEEGSITRALEAYKKAIELNPDLYYVYYDMGFIYFLQGQDLFNQAGQERDTDLRMQLNELATKKYNEAIPMLEKSVAINKDNLDIKKEALDVLKRIYYKLQMDEKYENVTKQLETIGR